MASPAFAALESRKPELLQGTTRRSLEPLRRYIQRMKDWKESEACVQTITWRAPKRDRLARSDTDIQPPAKELDRLLEERSEKKRRSKEAEKRRGVVVELVDQGRETEEAIKAFMAEGEECVFEDPSQLDVPDGKPRPERFSRETRIEIRERTGEHAQLRLAREPRTRRLLLRPNTWPEHCQLEAITTLQDGPGPHLRPLLRLFEATRHAEWPWYSKPKLEEYEWLTLTDRGREGTDEQRLFVEKALGTPDFAILEGPPGSGKTTAICELILQLVRDNKRVLLCASTHVAVDNVLERLMAEDSSGRETVIPIRIGESDKISDRVDPWRLKEVLLTERRRLQGHLAAVRWPSPAQRCLEAFLKQDDERLQRLVIETSNLACGTMIGILQHPDIQASVKGPREERAEPAPLYDVMILDEASKTTFQEFLVPARFARRWIVVGDPKQLSPHVDDKGLAENLLAACPDPALRDSCCDAFRLATKHGSHRHLRTAVVAEDDAGRRQRRLHQARARGLLAVEVETASLEQLAEANLFVGSRASLEARHDQLPPDAEIFRVPEKATSPLSRSRAAYERLGLARAADEASWEGELAWRISTLHALRHMRTLGRPGRAAALGRDIEALMPADDEQVPRKLEELRKVALPSVLELLCEGFGKPEERRDPTAFYNGLPDYILGPRHVLLTWQHRMHPEIARFSFEHIYQQRALHTPDRLAGERRWSYGTAPIVWRHVEEPGSPDSKAHPGEAKAVIRELEEFKAWAESNPSPSGKPWTVAVLAFYLDQQSCLREELRRWTGDRKVLSHFRVGSGSRALLELDLCTVDGFQGHEADLVILSLASQHTTHFLESPNRLNVALTRARFQRVIVGQHDKLRRGRGLLADLALAHTPTPFASAPPEPARTPRGPSQ